MYAILYVCMHGRVCIIMYTIVREYIYIYIYIYIYMCERTIYIHGCLAV